jgi:hypothetical protein
MPNWLVGRELVGHMNQMYEYEYDTNDDHEIKKSTLHQGCRVLYILRWSAPHENRRRRT